MSKKYYCDMCHKDMEIPPNVREYFIVGENSVAIRVKISSANDLCSECVRKVVSVGREGWT